MYITQVFQNPKNQINLYTLLNTPNSPKCKCTCIHVGIYVCVSFAMHISISLTIKENKIFFSIQFWQFYKDTKTLLIIHHYKKYIIFNYYYINCLILNYKLWSTSDGCTPCTYKKVYNMQLIMDGAMTIKPI